MTLQVTKSKKDLDGDITGLCGYGWNHSKSEVIGNLRTGLNSYFVSVNGRSVYVRIGTRRGRPYLTTAPDDYSPNNLDNLENC